MPAPKTIVIALGGNAITRESEEGNVYEQFANTRRALVSVARLAQSGYRIAMTHGNGPQVGNAMIRVEESRHIVPPLPLGIIVADLQGGMGYMIQQTMQNKFLKRHVDRPVVTMITQVLVDKNDPSIHNPTKFVGPVFPKDQVDALQRERGWTMREAIGRGWRRVVPSPAPLDIIEKKTIRELVQRGTLVITCGGGGIPVYREVDGTLEGVDAVIDKDLASAVLAKAIEAAALYILTAVEKISLNFSTPKQKDLSEMTVAQAEAWLAAGQFPAGSMGPNVRAAINFIKSGGKECIVTQTDTLVEALQGKTGTRIVE